MSLSRRLARPMLAAVFVGGGIDTLRNPGPRVKRAEEVVPDLSAKLGLPNDPELLVKVNAGIQVGAGVLFALGKFRRLAALALLGSLVPTTYTGHPFWAEEDPERRTQQQMHFLKNVGIAGGLLLALFDRDGGRKAGRKSERKAGRRVRQAAGHAGTAVSLGAASGAATARELGERAARLAAQDTKRLAASSVKTASKTAAEVGAVVGRLSRHD